LGARRGHRASDEPDATHLGGAWELRASLRRPARPVPPQARRRPPSEQSPAHDLPSAACATATRPAPTPNDAPPKAKARKRSCAASSATSPARPTPPSATTPDHSPPLGIYRNVSPPSEPRPPNLKVRCRSAGSSTESPATGSQMCPERLNAPENDPSQLTGQNKKGPALRVQRILRGASGARAYAMLRCEGCAESSPSSWCGR
jgi:hypothetical protein